MKPLLIFKTYAWIISTLRQYGPIKLADINALWQKERIGEGNRMVRQTFGRYKNDIEEFFNIHIGFDNQYRYFIDKGDALQRDTVQTWMLSSISVSGTLAHKQDIYDRIILEDIPSSGKFLKEIVEAMGNNQKIDIVYQRYMLTKKKEHTLAPYYLKIYNRRWFLVGKKDDGTMLTFALDRIIAFAVNGKKFKMDKKASAREYFKDCYGVMKDETKPAERIVLRAYGSEPNYLRDLKLHPSQKEIEITDEYSDFELFVRPSMDLRGKIMERGDRVKVLEPQHLADEILEILLNTVNNYKREKELTEL